jgi:hypothetical protein
VVRVKEHLSAEAAASSSAAASTAALIVLLGGAKAADKGRLWGDLYRFEEQRFVYIVRPHATDRKAHVTRHSLLASLHLRAPCCQAPAVAACPASLQQAAWPLGARPSSSS